MGASNGISLEYVDTYLKLLQDFIDPVLTDILESGEHYLEDQLVFQLDGAPSFLIACSWPVESNFSKSLD